MSVASARPRLLACIYTHNIWGGIERWFDDLVEYLRTEDWEVVIGLTRGRDFNLPSKVSAKYAAFRIVEFDGRTGTRIGRLRSLKIAVEKIQPHVIMSVGIGDVLPAVAQLKEQRHDLRLVTPIHANDPALLADVVRYADSIDVCVAVNEIQAEFLRGELAERRCSGDEWVQTIPNGVATPLATRRRQYAGGEPIRLLYVGRVNQEHKRVLDLVDVTRCLLRDKVNFELPIAGTGEDEPELRSRLAALQGAASSIRWLGLVDHETLYRDVYPAQDVLLSFSPSEGFGLAVLEAAIHGTVPVTSDFVGSRHLSFIVPNETAFLFPCGNTSAAAESVTVLAQSPELLARASAAAVAAAREFTIERSHARWRDLLLSTARRPSRRPRQTDRLHDERPLESRLERWGMSPANADRLRRITRRWPAMRDGWDEWPGTLSQLTPSEHDAARARLKQLHERARCNTSRR